MKRCAILLALAVSLLLVQTAAADLVVNGGFETGDFTGWTQSGNTDYTSVDTDSPHSGSYAVDLGPVGSLGFLSQTIATTAGASYTVGFWLQSDGSTPNEFAAYWGGTTIFDQVNVPSEGYTYYQFTEVASSTSTLIEFGFQNDPGYLNLDDISVNQVPIPGALCLLGSGLVGLIGLRKFRKE